MIYNEKYVTPQAAGGGDGLTEGTAWTFDEAAMNVAAGDRVNIKSGGYPVNSSTAPAVGTAEQYTVWRGYYQVIGDLDDASRDASTGRLVTTNFPSLSMNGFFAPAGYSIIQNLVLIGTRVDRIIGLNSGDHVIFRNLSVENRSDNTAAKCVWSGNYTTLINCDLANYEATHGPLALFDAGVDLIGCRFEGRASDAALVQANYLNADGCVFYGSAGCDGILLDASLSSVRMIVINRCTFYGLRSAVKVDPGATSVQAHLKLTHNHVTDCANWVNNGFVGGELVTLEENNRLRDITVPRVNCAPHIANEITTDAGGPETDYINAGNGDFRLLGTAAGATAGRYGGPVGALPASGGSGGIYDPLGQGRIR